jgi:DNA-binding CsgD family transcriptional regulator/PAS domain-containing protein
MKKAEVREPSSPGLPTGAACARMVAVSGGETDALQAEPTKPGEGELIALLEVLYGDRLAEASWDGFLRAFAGALEATYATLILTAPGARAVGEITTPDLGPDELDVYSDALFVTDPFVGLPEGEVVAFSEFVAGRTLNAEWRQFLESSGADQILGLDIHLPSGLEARFRLTRDRSRVDFGPAEKAAFQAIARHLRHAVRLHERLQTSAIEHGVYRGAIEQLALGALILDGRGTILRSNSVAERLLQVGDGLRSSDGRLRLENRAEQALLDQLLHDPPASGGATRLRISRPSGGRDLNATARAVSSTGYLGEGQPVLALFVADPDHAAPPSPDALREIFQLTRMEANLAAALADGSSLVQAANRLGIAHNTARSHLRSTFAKTGARRQSQLVRLIQQSLAELSGGG